MFLAAFFLAAWNSPSAANYDSPFLQRVWQSDQGLPHDSVNAIVQTRDGYLWIGTRKGVARFDGIRFTILDDIPEITNENVSALCEDKEGTLWIGTERGVARIKEGKISHYGQADGLVGDNVRTIHEGKDGAIWIGTATGLSRFQKGEFHNFTQSNGLPHNVVRSLCDDEPGLWIATDGGLCQFKDGTISVPDSVKELGKATRFVHLDQQKNLWVGTQIGIFRRNGNGWDHFDKNHGDLSDDFISTIFSDAGGNLWIGTYGGLTRLLNGKFINEPTAEGTAYDLVNAIFEDREGNFWIGSKEGLIRLKPKTFTAITKEQGLAYNNCMSVLQDKRGTFWCGTWGGGVFEMQPNAKNVTDLTVTNWLRYYRVLSLCERRDQSLWFGTDQGVGLFQLKDGALTHYDDKSGLEKVAIRVIYEDSAENLWVGTSSLNLFKDGKFSRETATDGFIGGIVRVIMEDHEGSLWIGTNRGLSRRKNGKFTNFSTKDGLSGETVLALHEDKENNLWIGTSGGGLNRLRHGKFTIYTTKQGLFNGEILEILEDDSGDLWMSCLKGIFRINKKAFDRFDRKEIETIPCTSYGKEDGMISIICNNVSRPAAWKASDGRLWFATTKGLAVADPKIKNNDAPPPVVIEEVMADKKRVSESVNQRTSEGKSAHSITDALIHNFTVAPGRGELEIHYTALSFRAPEKNRFKYKLEGVDPDWIEAGTRHVAYYNNIRPGHYNFRVVACNNDGVWNSMGANLKLQLLPHFWQTHWFLGLVGLTMIGGVAGIARYITWQKLQQKLGRLEQQHAVEKERSRIAKDMHDDVGATLTQISVLSQLAEKEAARPDQVRVYTSKITETSRELAQAMDEIVWAVNPKNDSLRHLVGYIFRFAEEFVSLTDLRLLRERPKIIPDVPFPAEARHNVFLVVKEAINNIVKHSGASEMRLSLDVTGEELLIQIEDNGHGFSPETLDSFGNGLENMKKRIEDVGGRFALSSATEGTRIKLAVPLPAASR
jgi:ligand-binding sensor domain-containing protein/signal transduction histidine kinase